MPRGRTWYHHIRFPDGTETDGTHPPDRTFQECGVQEAWVKGKRVWDVGAADLGLSLKFLEMGAAHVTALELEHYPGHDILRNKYPGLLPKDRFLLTTGAGADIESTDFTARTMSDAERPDLIFFPGVLYHLRGPYNAIRNLAHVAKDGTRLCLETHGTKFADDSRALMEWIPKRALNDDPTNFWQPNAACVLGMLQRAGWREGKLVHEHEQAYGNGTKLQGKSFRFAFQAVRGPA